MPALERGPAALSSDGVARQGGHVEEMQRRRLLLAMVEVLGEHGFESASVGRVCKRAGVSRRTFYEIFDDRDECLLAALDDAVERIGEPVLAAWAGVGSWRERIRGALVALLERFDAEPEMARMCVVETLKAGPSVAERRSHLTAVLVGAVELGRGEARRGNEPPTLAGQGVVGGVLSVIQARLLETPSSATKRSAASADAHSSDSATGTLIGLTGPLMAMIVHPYLGSAAARRELNRPTPKATGPSNGALRDPFKDLQIRFTYRTARVLATIATNRGASNRLVADTSGIADEGQTSRLLARLQRAELIENRGAGREKGEANAWTLTERGEAVQAALAGG